MLPPQESGDEAEEGREAHSELERRVGPLDGEFVDPATMPILPADDDHPAAYAVAMMIAFIRQIPPGRMWVEKRVQLTPQIWGTADIQHWHEESGTLTIPDLKNGMRAVDPDKEQNRLYGAASMFTHNLPVKWLRSVIVQPYDWRPFVPRVKQHVEDVDSLYAWAQKVAAIPYGPRKFTAGPHCRDCPLFGKCDASTDMLSNFGAVMFGLASPESVPLAQRALFMALDKPISDTFKNAKKIWEKAAIAGSVPPGMKLVTARGHKSWVNPVEARALVLEKLGVDALDLPTPAQAIERGIDEAAVNALAPRPNGSPVLAFDNDKRPEWKLPTGSSMFAGLMVKIDATST